MLKIKSLLCYLLIMVNGVAAQNGNGAVEDVTTTWWWWAFWVVLILAVVAVVVWAVTTWRGGRGYQGPRAP